MNTKEWILYPSTRVPKWNSENQQLCWDSAGDAITVELPAEITSVSDAQHYLDESYACSRGDYAYCGWDVRCLY